jgi:hypothetical protein
MAIGKTTDSTDRAQHASGLTLCHILHFVSHWLVLDLPISRRQAHVSTQAAVSAGSRGSPLCLRPRALLVPSVDMSCLPMPAHPPFHPALLSAVVPVVLVEGQGLWFTKSLNTKP